MCGPPSSHMDVRHPTDWAVHAGGCPQVARLPQDDKEALLDGEPGTPRYEAALNEYRREFVNRQPRQCAETARCVAVPPIDAVAQQCAK